MKILTSLLACVTCLYGANQTATLSPVLPETSLPYTLAIETASFTLPTGIQGFATATYKGKWIFIGGRTNGLHGFSNIGNNFPPSLQNQIVYVVDPSTGESFSRSLADPTSGLSVEEIDDLSVVAPESFQKKNTLYFVGGYGINTLSGQMETKPRLTLIDLKKLVKWVETGCGSAKAAIRQLTHPLLQVTGGFLYQNSDHDPFLLMMGQNFIGLYTDSSNGLYTQQVRKFWLSEVDGNPSIYFYNDAITYPDYRRRDFNIAPIIRRNCPAYAALSGVFTLTTGVWTVPILIYPDGSSYEADPLLPTTFKQAMNNYNCPFFGLYSSCKEDMYVVLPGGISFGYFSGSTFTTDSEIPFINQITTVKIDRNDQFSQYLMDAEYPVIPSTGSNPGNPLLFGAEAIFFPADGIPLYPNGVIQMDRLPKKPTVIGYIAGGIMSTLPNTNTPSDSTASPYVFKVIWAPK
jgi:hypothetical protein